MHNTVLSHVVQRDQYLNSESFYQRQVEALEIVHFDEIVEVDRQEFKRNAKMLSAYELLKFLNNIFLVIRVLFIQ